MIFSPAGGYGVVSDRPRILVLEGPGQSADHLCPLAQDCDLVRMADLSQGLDLLRTGQFDGVFADTRDPSIRRWAGNLLRAEHVLEALSDGVAVVDADLR